MRAFQRRFLGNEPTMVQHKCPDGHGSVMQSFDNGDLPPRSLPKCPVCRKHMKEGK